MDADSILRTFASIPQAAKENVLNVKPITSNLSLAVNHDGDLGLFFSLSKLAGVPFRRSMKALDLVSSDDFQISSTSGGYDRSAGYLVVLRHKAASWRFAAIACDLTWTLGADPERFDSEPSIDNFIMEWAELFSLEQMRSKVAIGLWGELWALCNFPVLDRGVSCWTGPLGAPFDFTGNGLRLEIKTSIGLSTAWFNVDQLSSPDDAFTLFVRASQDPLSGENLDDLVEKISESLSELAPFQALLGRIGYFPGAKADMRLNAEEALMLRNVDIPVPICPDSRIRTVRFSISVDDFRGQIVSNSKVFENLARLE
jgi:hypothetical protein